MNKFNKDPWKLFCVISIFLSLQSCVGIIVGAAVDTTIEVAKVPFKVVSVAVNLDDDDDDDDDDG